MCVVVPSASTKSLIGSHSASWSYAYFYSVRNWKSLLLFRCPKISPTSYSVVPHFEITGTGLGSKSNERCFGCDRYGRVFSTWTNGWIRILFGSSSRTALFQISSIILNGLNRRGPNFFEHSCFAMAYWNRTLSSQTQSPLVYEWGSLLPALYTLWRPSSRWWAIVASRNTSAILWLRSCIDYFEYSFFRKIPIVDLGFQPISTSRGFIGVNFQIIW